SIAPFGKPVVPDVYEIRATSSGRPAAASSSKSPGRAASSSPPCSSSRGRAAAAAAPPRFVEEPRPGGIELSPVLLEPRERQEPPVVVVAEALGVVVEDPLDLRQGPPCPRKLLHPPPGP